MDKLQIMSHIENTRDYLIKTHFSEHSLLGLFLYGSQNYGFATEESDIDLVAVVVPEWNDIVALKQPLSTTITLPNGELCMVKDIRVMRDMLLKQNLNFIETLFTEYKWVNPFYADIYQDYFLDNAETIARYCPWRTLFSALRQAAHKQKATPKRVHNVARFLYFAEMYDKGQPYVKCFRPEGKAAENLMQLKLLSEDNPKLEKLYEAVLKKTEEALEKIEAMPLEKKNYRNEAVEEFTLDGVSEILTRYFNFDEIFLMGWE